MPAPPACGPRPEQRSAAEECGSVPHGDGLGVGASLQIYADDIGLSLSTVLNYRFRSGRRLTVEGISLLAGPWHNGRKRHIVVDTRGLVLLGIVTPADMPTGMQPVKSSSDSAYAGALVTWAKTRVNVTLRTVRRPPNTSGFTVLPRRWVVERSLSWIMRARRHCRDHERLPRVSETLITWASITLMTRRLTRHPTRRGRRLPVAATA